MTTQFNGQDVQCRTLADANNAYIIKRRDTYMFCSFKTGAERAAFKSALGAVSNITFSDYPYAYTPVLYVVKITPT